MLGGIFGDAIEQYSFNSVDVAIALVRTKLVLTNVEIASLVLRFLIVFITELFVINKFTSYLQKNH